MEFELCVGLLDFLERKTVGQPQNHHVFGFPFKMVTWRIYHMFKLHIFQKCMIHSFIIFGDWDELQTSRFVLLDRIGMVQTALIDMIISLII